MANIGALLSNFDWKGLITKPEKTEQSKGKNQDANKPNKDGQSPYEILTDTFDKKTVHILDDDYAKAQILGDYSTNEVTDFGKEPIRWTLTDSSNDKPEKQTFTVDNRRPDLKNHKEVVNTNKEDVVVLQGEGWKKTGEDVTDEASKKAHEKDPEQYPDIVTGDLYEDNNGNKVLVEGDGKVDIQPGVAGAGQDGKETQAQGKDDGKGKK